MDAVDERLREWRREATHGFADIIASSPQADVPAYPQWTLAELAIHVVRVYSNARIALSNPKPERPQPQLEIGPKVDPDVLAAAVRDALDAMESAREACRLDSVWTPVGVRPPGFWERRILREAILHRWDAQQALGEAEAPPEAQALTLIDEFFDTDVTRAFEAGGQGAGVVVIDVGPRRWNVDLAYASITRQQATNACAAAIRGDAASVWLWLMRREGLPGTVEIDDRHAGASVFDEMIERFNRPSR